MRIVEMLQPVQKGEVKMETGKKYVMPDDMEFQLRAMYPNGVGMSIPLEQVYKPYRGEDLTGKKLMAWRTGGVGDLFFMNPVIRFMKERYKNCFLRIASGCKQPLENLPEIDELYDLPFDATLLDGMDYHLIFQGILETASEKSKRKHAVDMFFDYFSIDSTQLPREKKIPKLVFKKEEIAWMEKKTREMGIVDTDFVIGFQMESSAALRNPPRGQIKGVIETLLKEPNVKIMLVGAAEHKPLAEFYKGGAPNALLATGFSVRESIVLVNRYDMVIGPDSFLMQAAGALRKPIIGLYGPFPSELRLQYFDNAIGLEAKVPCSPCFLHDSEPCIKGYPSPCFSLLETGDILEALDFQKYKLTGTHFNFMAPILTPPNFQEIEKYFLSADKGLCFFGGYYKHSNMIRVDLNTFCKPDISNLSMEFKRDFFPFVVYCEEFDQRRTNIYQGAKTLVRPGGYFVAYKTHADEPFIENAKRDIGRDFTLIHVKFDPIQRTALIVGKKKL